MFYLFTKFKKFQQGFLDFKYFSSKLLNYFYYKLYTNELSKNIEVNLKKTKPLLLKSLEIILKSVLNISDNIAQLYRGHVCLMYTVVVCFIVIIRSVSFILLAFSVILCCYLLLLV